LKHQAIKLAEIVSVFKVDAAMPSQEYQPALEIVTKPVLKTKRSDELIRA
jgi:hypothetical protein